MPVVVGSNVDCIDCKEHNILCLRARISSAAVFIGLMSALFFVPHYFLGIKELGKVGVFIIALPLFMYAAALASYQFPFLIKRRNSPTKF